MGRDDPTQTEIQFTPARVLMQDFTGVPCIIDLVAMRESLGLTGQETHTVHNLAELPHEVEVTAE